MTVFTIGHSNRLRQRFIDALHAHAVDCVIDIRSFPHSRHNPQFNSEALSAGLRAESVGYEHRVALGGRRKPVADSINQGWRNAGFRGYADYMQTPEFERQIEELVALSRHTRIALMCAEALPWRCHRRLVADALLVRTIAVEHIIDVKQTRGHTLTPWAEVEADRVSYPFVLHG